MRRSLAPSQLKSRPSVTVVPPMEKQAALEDNDGSEKDLVIGRMPMFGFLEIPDGLKKQFRIPSGCVITKKSVELRQIKSLGPVKRFQPLQPGDLARGLLRTELIVQPPVDGDAESDREEESGAFPPHQPLILWTDDNDDSNIIQVVPELACKLRPHQREGVQFLFECTMGLRGFEGFGCILADDMGLGKTLMSITLLWTLLNQGFVKGESACRKVVIVCPTSLVGNWCNEIKKWVGEKCIVFPVSTEPKRTIKSFIQHRSKGVLIISYETQRRYSSMFAPPKTVLPGSNTAGSCCDLLICDEAHKLKNAESGLAKSLNELPARKRILLSGTPMQNELTEFYNMVNFCNPGVIGSPTEFRKRYERPILLSREPDASPEEKNRATSLQKELSTIVNEFILKRGNILNAQHLPPKLVQFICCRLSPLQEKLYDAILNSKEVRHIRDGKQLNTLNTIRQMINICSHPRMILDTYHAKLTAKEDIDEDLLALVRILEVEGVGKAPGGNSRPQPQLVPRVGRSGIAVPPKPVAQVDKFVDPELSGKLLVLWRMMQTLRALKQGERIVIVSNYTQTLDLIEQLCSQNNWPVHRLDGTTTATKRTRLVETFNDANSGAFAFLLSSKAGGCGINLIGGSRLVLFDPDWNPASDKQAAGRIWREGQKRRCFIYRFMSTGTIEEKIIQRQLSKEGLQNIVDNREQINEFSTSELRRLFVRREDTISDTHDTLRCKRCKTVNIVSRGASVNGESSNLLPEQLEVCSKFLTDFVGFLEESRLLAVEDCHEETPSAPSIQPFAELLILQQDLMNGKYPTLPLFSRQLRGVIFAVEQELSMPTEEGQPPRQILPRSISISSEFVSRWSEIVPQLAQLAKSHQQACRKAATALGKSKRNKKSNATNLCEKENCQTSNMDGVEADEEDEGEELDDHAEQEGCPEDTDFNRWSHHCNVSTCDDEVLRRAMSDDSTVSFVFGLEVNWSLLQSSEEEKKEEVAERKRQAEADLRELNEKRRLEKLKAQELKPNQGEADGEELSALDDLSGDEGKASPKAETSGKKRSRTAGNSSNNDNTSSSSSSCAQSASKLRKVKKKREAEILTSGDDSESDVDTMETPRKPSTKRHSPKPKKAVSPESSDDAFVSPLGCLGGSTSDSTAKAKDEKAAKVESSGRLRLSRDRDSLHLVGKGDRLRTKRLASPKPSELHAIEESLDEVEIDCTFNHDVRKENKKKMVLCSDDDDDNEATSASKERLPHSAGICVEVATVHVSKNNDFDEDDESCQWTCAACTYCNRGGATCCDMCGSSKTGHKGGAENSQMMTNGKFEKSRKLSLRRR